MRQAVHVQSVRALPQAATLADVFSRVSEISLSNLGGADILLTASGRGHSINPLWAAAWRYGCADRSHFWVAP